MSSLQRLVSLLLLVSIGASSVEVVFGENGLTGASAQSVSVGSPDTSAGGDLPGAPGQPPGETSDCACLCACACTGANSAVVPAVVFADFEVCRSELPPPDFGHVHPLEAPSPPFRPPLA